MIDINHRNTLLPLALLTCQCIALTGCGSESNNAASGDQSALYDEANNGDISNDPNTP